MSSGAILANASHGIGEPAYWRPPNMKRATNVSRSGNFISALPGRGVMFGGLNASTGLPPEYAGTVGAPVSGLYAVWQPPQLATERAIYAPRATVGAAGG